MPKENYIVYKTNGRGKRATDIQVTPLGITFFHEMMRLHPSLRRVSSTEKFMDLDTQNRLRTIPAPIIDLDVKLKGAIGKWRCPFHPKSAISYEIIKGICAVTICQECKEEKRWYFDSGLSSDLDTSGLPPLLRIKVVIFSMLNFLLCRCPMQTQTQQSIAVIDAKSQVTKDDLFEVLDRLEKILKEALEAIG